MENALPPSFRYLHIFDAVARLESISRASSEIRISQPAVTLAIAKLERSVGVPLFERRRTGTYLSPYGRALHARVTRLFGQMQSALVEFGLETSSKSAGAASVARQITRSQMLCLNAIAQKGSLAQAAQSMNISQVMLHRVMRSFEKALGSSLYRHTAYGVLVTRSAAELARRMMVAAKEIEYAIDELHTTQGVIGSRIAVGVQILGSSSLIGNIADKWVASYPKAHVNIISDGYGTLLQNLRTGEIDLMVGLLRRPPPFPDVMEELLFMDPYVIVARKGHPLAGGGVPALKQLAGFDWVLTSARRNAFNRLFNDLESPPHVSVETQSITIIRAILSNSDQLTLLTRYEMQFEERLGALTKLPTDALVTEAPAPIGMTTRKDWMPTAVQAAFVEMLRTEARMPG